MHSVSQLSESLDIYFYMMHKQSFESLRAGTIFCFLYLKVLYIIVGTLIPDILFSLCIFSTVLLRSFSLWTCELAFLFQYLENVHF